MNSPFLVPVAGFLGAGKTTLILAASRVLKERGLEPAVILNDQGGELVDTAHVLQHDVLAREVVGGCFCCRFSELIAVADQLRAIGPDVIFIEPVGSCTDLAATVMRPLLMESQGQYRIAPLTVLVDRLRMAELLDSSLRYLIEKQIAEADIVVFSKSDLGTASAELSGPPVRSVSARTGQGIEAWLDEVLSGELAVGARLLDVDYKQYAQAEAALGWLNWSATIELEIALSPAELIGPWLDRLQAAFSAQSATLAHLKVSDQAGGAYLKAALTSNRGEPAIEGDLAASPEKVHAVRFNLRAVMPPEALRKLFERESEQVQGNKCDVLFQCFSPAAPQPERHVGVEAAKQSTYGSR